MANRLIHEKSPYLLEHAENPVDWHPFGNEAFALAQRLDRPVFVSVGYMSCHWCHVMARESFESQAVADALNAGFVSVKVDREEHPELDALCMSACQLMTGSGGWPLSVFMTPGRAPFFAGTYFPPRASRGQPGFLELLEAIAQAWDADRESLLAHGDRLLAALKSAQRHPPGEMRAALIDRCLAELRAGYDPEFGGFSRAPKFPMPHALGFLMDAGDGPALRMALSSMRHMALGGVFDQVGGGFCRYATDRRWLIPHFEKMLYDNALLLDAYCEAHRRAKDPLFSEVARRTLDYLLLELRAPEGGFYSAQDADSEGREGAYYLFTRREVIGALGAPEGAALCDALGITDAGDFEGRSIPNRLSGRALPPTQALYAYRRARMALRVDTKILTGWNALAIAALAKAAGALDRPDALEAALDALRCIEERLGGQGALLAVYAGGAAKLPGSLDDHAFLCLALIALYDATLEPGHMRRAEALLERAHALFFDAADAGYFLGQDDGRLPLRPKQTHDGALPSGNSAMGLALLRMARWTGAPRWQDRCAAQMRFLASAAEASPSGHAAALHAGRMYLAPATELVCVAREQPHAQAFCAFAKTHTPPGATVVLCTPENRARQPDWVRALPENGQTSYHLCQGGACALPVDSLEELAGQLARQKV